MQHIKLTGMLDAEHVPKQLKDSKNWFDKQQSLTLDLSGIERADSAGVALLLEWQRQARKAGIELKLTHMPKQISAIIDLSGLNEVLG